MKRRLSIRFNELVRRIKLCLKQWTKGDDNDWLDHPDAIFLNESSHWRDFFCNLLDDTEC